MKTWQWITIGLTLGGVGLGALLAATNPGEETFESFAIEQMKSQLCPELPLGLAKQCPRLIDENESQVKRLIRSNTERQSYVLFSHYQTQLSLRAIVPDSISALLPALPIPTSYQLEAIGVLGQFYVYRAESQRL